jgi:hypothetical protein
MASALAVDAASSADAEVAQSTPAAAIHVRIMTLLKEPGGPFNRSSTS